MTDRLFRDRSSRQQDSFRETSSVLHRRNRKR